MRKFLKTLSTPRKAIGLYVYRLPQGSWQGAGVVLARQGNRVQMVAQWQGHWPAEPFPDAFKGLPVALCVDGKGVLHKTISTDHKNAPVAEQAKIAFTGVVVKDFCVQSSDGATGTIISLLRKESVTELLGQLDRIGLPVISIALGPFGGASLLYTLSRREEAENPIVGFTQLTLQRGKVLAFGSFTGPSLQMVMVGEDQLPAYALPAYAAALELLLGQVKSPELGSEPVVEGRRRWQQRKQVKQMRLGLLAFFFTALLINFFVFSYYSGKVAEAEALLRFQHPERLRIGELSQQLQEREGFLQNAGWLHPSRLSVYADRLAASTPKGIRLWELAVYPINAKESKQAKQSLFDTGVLRVQGVCQEPQMLESWLQTLVAEPWVQRLAPPDYHFGERTRKGEFTLLIYLNAP